MELIGKRELLEELGIDTNCHACPRYDGGCRGHLRWLCKKIDEASVIELGTDIVSVVRCEDCKWFERKTMLNIRGSYPYCNLIKGMTHEDGFCHMGERRENDSTV